MKFFFVFLLAILAIFTSCDGKQRAQKTHQEIIEDSNLSSSFFEQVSYIPEQYTESITDTILSNGYKIHTKFYSDMNSNVLNEFELDSIIYKEYYREYKSELEVEYQGEIIFKKIIEKSLFADEENDFFWKKSIMLGLHIVEENTTNTSLYLHTSFCIPESEICKDFNIIIDNTGKLEIKELITENIH